MAAEFRTERSSPGFTIIELMIVLVIAAIVASIAVPSFRANIANQRNKAAAQQLLLALQQARNEARKFNGGCTIRFIPADSSDFAAGWGVAGSNPGTTDVSCSRDLNLDGDTTDTGEVMGTAADIDGDGNTTDTGEQSVFLHSPGIEGVSITPSAATAAITYNRSGRVTVPTTISTLTIDVCDDDDLGFKRTLSIDISGAPSVERTGTCP